MARLWPQPPEGGGTLIRSSLSTSSSCSARLFNYLVQLGLTSVKVALQPDNRKLLLAFVQVLQSAPDVILDLAAAEDYCQ
jgi:hypothetical protein